MVPDLAWRQSREKGDTIGVREVKMIWLGHLAGEGEATTDAVWDSALAASG